MTRNASIRIAIIALSWLVVLAIFVFGTVYPDVELRAAIEGQASLAGPPTATPSSTPTATSLPTATSTPAATTTQTGTATPDATATEKATVEALSTQVGLAGLGVLLGEQFSDRSDEQTESPFELWGSAVPLIDGDSFLSSDSLSEQFGEVLSLDDEGQIVFGLEVFVDGLSLLPSVPFSETETTQPQLPPIQADPPLTSTQPSTSTTALSPTSATATATPMPTRAYEVHGDYPQVIEAEKSAEVNLHLVRVGSNFAIEVDESNTITFAEPLLPLPEGTPGVPIEQAFGPDLVPCAVAHLQGAAFTIDDAARGCRPLNIRRLTWAWSIRSKDNAIGPERLKLVIVFHWKPVNGGDSRYQVDAWTDTKQVDITKPLFSEIQPVALAASVGWSLLMSVVNIPFLYTFFRKRDDENDTPDETIGNMDPRFQTVDEPINVADEQTDGNMSDGTSPDKAS